MDIIEGNRLIAEFMEVIWRKEHKMWSFHHLPDQPAPNYTKWWSALHYHEFWDWTIRACKKFDHLPLTGMVYQEHCDNIDHAVTTYEILPVWNALTEAIQWYNNTQTPQP